MIDSPQLRERVCFLFICITLMQKYPAVLLLKSLKHSVRNALVPHPLVRSWVRRDRKGNKSQYFGIVSRYDQTSAKVKKTCYTGRDKQKRLPHLSVFSVLQFLRLIPRLFAPTSVSLLYFTLSNRNNTRHKVCMP